MKTMCWMMIALAQLSAADGDSHLRSLVRKIQTEVKPDQAMAYMHDVYATDRWFTFLKFEETAGYLKRTLTEIGLSGVEMLRAPADGVTQ